MPALASSGQDKAPSRALKLEGPFDDFLDLVEALGERFGDSFEVNWLSPDAPLEANCQILQDNGDYIQDIPLKEALRVARNLRDAGAGGTWTVETEDGELVALFH